MSPWGVQSHRRLSSADFPRLVLVSKPSDSSVRSERVLSERVLGAPFTRLITDGRTGRSTFQTVELVEKTIEQEVDQLGSRASFKTITAPPSF